MSLPEGKEKGIVTDGVFRFWDTEWPSTQVELLLQLKFGMQQVQTELLAKNCRTDRCTSKTEWPMDSR